MHVAMTIKKYQILQVRFSRNLAIETHLDKSKQVSGYFRQLFVHAVVHESPRYRSWLR